MAVRGLVWLQDNIFDDIRLGSQRTRPVHAVHTWKILIELTRRPSQRLVCTVWKVFNCLLRIYYVEEDFSLSLLLFLLLQRCNRDTKTTAFVYSHEIASSLSTLLSTLLKKTIERALQSNFVVSFLLEVVKTWIGFWELLILFGICILDCLNGKSF